MFVFVFYKIYNNNMQKKHVSKKYMMHAFTLIKKIPLVLLVVAFFIISTTAYAEDEVYQSATEFDYPPFSVANDGVADGFSVDLLKAVAKEIGIEVTFKIDEWSVIKSELEEGSIDVLPLVAYNEERDKLLDFTVPYIILHGNIFVRDGSDIKSEEDLIGKEIIVMRDDSLHEFAIKKNYTDNLILTSTYTEAFELLASGKYDAVLSQNLTGQLLIEDLEITNIHPVTKIIEENQTAIRLNLEGFDQKFCFAVKEGDKELLSKLNEGLSIVSANGTFNTLYAKWFPFMIENNLTIWEKIQSSSLIIIPSIILILIVAIIITWQQIRKKKAELEESNHNLLMLEAHLIQKQKLESIGTLASGVAHEINNPINGIMNYSQIISDMSSSGSQCSESCDDIHTYSKEIIKESKRISSIVNNLLQFARTEKKSYSMADIPTIIDGVLTLVSVIAKKNQIQIEISIDDDLPPINCRTQQIQQILVNLITNAKDALNAKYPGFSEDKKIIISAKKYIFKGKESVRISVRDNGNGISYDVKKNIFDPFFTTKDRSKGTGLGLSISYSIAEEHGGQLSFETGEGEYTTFHLDLPLVSKD